MAENRGSTSPLQKILQSENVTQMKETFSELRENIQSAFSEYVGRIGENFLSILGKAATTDEEGQRIYSEEIVGNVSQAAAKEADEETKEERKSILEKAVQSVVNTLRTKADKVIETARQKVPEDNRSLTEVYSSLVNMLEEKWAKGSFLRNIAKYPIAAAASFSLPIASWVGGSLASLWFKPTEGKSRYEIAKDFSGLISDFIKKFIAR